MANKTKKVKNNSARKGAEKLEIRGSFGADKAFVASLSEQAKQNWLEVRTRFAGLDIMVKKNQDVFAEGFVLEVGKDGQPTATSHLRLQEQAITMLAANFKPRAYKADDLGWATARWSTSAAAREAGLDPTVEFEVGLTVSRNPNADRAVRMLELIECGHTLEGLSLIPNEAGKHLDIPAGAAISHPGVVVVRRGNHDLELTSLTNALLKSRVSEWAKPTAEEKAEAKAKAEADAKAKAEEEKAEAAFGVFDDVLADIEAAAKREAEAEAERQEAERQAQLAAEWADIVNARPDLVAAWEQARQEANSARAAIEPEVTMILGIARPGQPSREAVKLLASKVHRDAFMAIAGWVKDTHASREGLPLQESVAMFGAYASNDMVLDDLWPALDWIVDGMAVPEAAELGSYSTRAEWLEVVQYHPGLSAETTSKLMEMANSEVPA